MHKIRTFFDTNIQLNKGYASKHNRRRISDSKSNNTNTTFSGDKDFPNILPPVEILAEYESIYPGTLAQLLKMASIEQKHRHDIDHQNLASWNKTLKSNKYIAAIALTLAVVAVSISTIALAILAEAWVPVAFATLAFFSLGAGINKVLFANKQASANKN